HFSKEKRGGNPVTEGTQTLRLRREVEAIRDTRPSGPCVVLSQARRKRLEKRRSFRHPHGGDARTIERNIDGLHSETTKASASGAPGLHAQACALGAIEKARLLEKGVPFEPTG